MSIEYLSVLKNELPEVFQHRDVAENFDEDCIIVPIENPEWNPDESETILPLHTNAPNAADFKVLEDNALSNEEPVHAVNDPSPSTKILDIFSNAHPGAPVPYTDRIRMPPPECMAFYLPFHYYYPTWWGVYLFFEGVLWLSQEIIRLSPGRVNWRAAIRAARIFLYYHEVFHHKTECFATRLELTHRKPFFKTGFERYYQKTIGTADCIEESLANAHALENTSKTVKDRSIEIGLTEYVKFSPPGYDQGAAIRQDAITYRCKFAETNQNICLPHLPKKNHEVWRTAPYMFNGISKITSRVNYIVPRSSPIVSRLPFRPLLPPNKLIKKLKLITKIEFVRNGGNHDIYRTPSGKMIPIPRHQRDLSRGIVHKILRELGLGMSLNEFMQI